MKLSNVLIAAALVLPATASTVLANGCNGVVSQLEWGCAMWDNNNGPQYPHWHGAPQRQVPTQGYNRSSGIVAQGGGNIVAQGGGNIVAQGGGNRQGGH